MTQPITNPVRTLQGEALTELFDRAYALLQERADSSITLPERQAAVAELLRQQPLAPSNLRALGYLHDLWLQIDQPFEANAALHQHRAAAMANEGADESTAFDWELLNLQSRWLINEQNNTPADHSEGIRQLATLMAQMQADPGLSAQESQKWLDVATRYQAWELIQAHMEWQHGDVPDEDSPVAWREADFHHKLAELDHRRGNAAGIDTHLQTALKHLKTDDGELSLRDWLHFANRTLRFAPQHVATFIQAATARLCDNPPQDKQPSTAQRRYRLAHLARVQAKAHHAQGEVQQALACAQLGLYLLDQDEDDLQFAAQVMQWHADAGNQDEAAELAVQGLLHECSPGSKWAQNAWVMALHTYHHDTNPQRLALWWCLLAWAGIDPDTRELLQGDEDGDNRLPPPPHPPEECLAQARQHVPGHPLADLIDGVHLAHQQQWQAALPLLEKSITALPQHANCDFLTLLWAARLVVLPIKKALARPLPQSQGARWNCLQGDLLDGNLPKKLTTLVQESQRQHLPPLETIQTKLQTLAKRSYETGMQQFEAFFANGRGHYQNAAPHSYAILCHNFALTVSVKSSKKALDTAIALETKGLAVGHFFLKQRRSQLRFMVQKLDDNFPHNTQDRQALVRTAEAFWHISCEQSDNDYTPPRYFEYVTATLAQLQRHSEVGLWIDRLHQWYEALNEEEQRDHQLGFLQTLVFMLLHVIKFTSPQQARPYLQRHHNTIINLADYPQSGPLLIRCAKLYEELQDIPQALALYGMAEKCLNIPNNEYHKGFLPIAQAGSKRCNKLLRRQTGKPFWKFW